MVPPGQPPILFDKPHFRDEPISFSDIINDKSLLCWAFDWEDTLQGSDFWYEEHKSRALSNDAKRILFAWENAQRQFT